MATQDEFKENAALRLKEPAQYNVIMHNDDFTTMVFVVSVLEDIFHKDKISAEAIMMNVHKNGRAVVGKYPYDLAITKVTEALKRAKAQGFPFRMTVEEA
ncbi:MAG: ATP-dependent Clp protease adaptor ClpS [Lachnospiraceae bacterium]|nr:ATP-dependent Clp protease adaptor ClpS [Lachnospiraceae bacterium]